MDISPFNGYIRLLKLNGEWHMIILWRDEMDVGDEKINNDHKYLICLINTFEAAISCNVGTKVLSYYVAQLLAYTEEHFAREEKLQDKIEYPYREAHRKEHKDLVLRLKHIHEGIAAHKEQDVYQKEIPNLISILRDWLLHHILNEDMRMKEYLTPKKGQAQR